MVKYNIYIICKNEDQEISIKADYLLPFYGLKMELGPIHKWGINIHENLIYKICVLCNTDMH